jgi:hypothetical protein
MPHISIGKRGIWRPDFLIPAKGLMAKLESLWPRLPEGKIEILHGSLSTAPLAPPVSGTKPQEKSGAIKSRPIGKASGALKGPPQKKAAHKVGPTQPTSTAKPATKQQIVPSPALSQTSAIRPNEEEKKIMPTQMVGPTNSGAGQLQGFILTGTSAAQLITPPAKQQPSETEEEHAHPETSHKQ